MTTDEIRGWFAGRLPEGLFEELVEVTTDREEITVIGRIPTPRSPPTPPTPSAPPPSRAGSRSSASAPASDRMKVAREAERRFDRKVSWGVECDETRALFTHVAAPVMTRLRQPERRVLDLLVAGGVARSRSDALGWCVRLVQQHADDWLAELRDSLVQVEEVRRRGPAAEPAGRPTAAAVAAGEPSRSTTTAITASSGSRPCLSAADARDAVREHEHGGCGGHRAGAGEDQRGSDVVGAAGRQRDADAR